MPDFSKDNYSALNQLVKDISENRNKASRQFSFGEKKVDDLIAEEKAIKNRGLAQDIELRKETLRKLFFFLAIETAIIFLFSFFQAIHWPNNFRLEEWSFKLLVTVTITQITIMLLVAVKYLFPNQKK